RQRLQHVLRVLDLVGLNLDDETLVAVNVAAAAKLQDEGIAVGPDGAHRHRAARLEKDELRARRRRGRYRQHDCAEGNTPTHCSEQQLYGLFRLNVSPEYANSEFAGVVAFQLSNSRRHE